MYVDYIFIVNYLASFTLAWFMHVSTNTRYCSYTFYDASENRWKDEWIRCELELDASESIPFPPAAIEKKTDNT